MQQGNTDHTQLRLCELGKDRFKSRLGSERRWVRAGCQRDTKRDVRNI